MARHLAMSLEDKAVTTFAGNDHFVYVVNDRYAFRFPKSPESGHSSRSGFLKLLRDTVSIRVPAIEVHQDTETSTWFETYPFIPGVPLTRAVVQSFPVRDRIAIAGQLGAFLGSVHRFSVDQARTLGLDEMQPDGYGDYLTHHPKALPMVRRFAYPMLSDTERAWVETVFATFVSLNRGHPFQTCVTHADMWPQHIVVNPDQRRVTGVIDFWGRIADPANDFKVFESYGRDFVTHVYEAYPLATDEYFEQRRLFYSGHDAMMQLTRAIADNNADEAQRQRRLLAIYIVDHPVNMSV